MNRPKDWWGDPENALEWINQVKKHKNDLSYTEQPNLVFNEVKKRAKELPTILEVGAGDGHIIGKLSSKSNLHCSSVDINEQLSSYVGKHYPKVLTFVGEITDLPFLDDSFDLVYTYQVLQHIAPDEIEKAISELKRVCKKEVWAWEGIGRGDYNHGDQTHKAHNGSFVWHIDKMENCYEVSIPQNKKISLDRQRLYKIKK